MLSNSRAVAMIPAVDLGRARKWYEEMLDIRPIEERPGGLIYELGGGSAFMLYPNVLPGDARNTSAGFLVADIEAEVSALRERGVEFEGYELQTLKTTNGVATFEGNKAAWFKDSEGNVLTLVQLT